MNRGTAQPSPTLPRRPLRRGNILCRLPSALRPPPVAPPGSGGNGRRRCLPARRRTLVVHQGAQRTRPIRSIHSVLVLVVDFALFLRARPRRRSLFPSFLVFRFDTFLVSLLGGAVEGFPLGLGGLGDEELLPFPQTVAPEVGAVGVETSITVFADYERALKTKKFTSIDIKSEQKKQWITTNENRS